jgi:hypothetical protein
LLNVLFIVDNNYKQHEGTEMSSYILNCRFCVYLKFRNHQNENKNRELH